MTAINEKSFRFTGSRIGMVLVVWAIAVSLAGYMGLFIQIPGLGIAFLVIGGIVGLLAFYYRSPGVKAFVIFSSSQIFCPSSPVANFGGIFVFVLR